MNKTHRTYDFETILDRSGTGSVKWEQMKSDNPNVEEGIVPFSIADMEFKNPPEITEGLKACLDEIVLGYQTPEDSYRTAVTSWVKRRYGWEARPEWLINTIGVINAFSCGIRAFAGEGEGVILMTPVYPPFAEGICKNGRKLYRCPLICQDGTYTINFTLLEQLAEKPDCRLLILCNPHNLVGRVWTREELMRVGEICLKNNVFVISDEVHCDIIMEGYKFTSFASVSEEFAENCMICLSPGKTFNLAGIKSGCIFVRNGERRSALLDEISKVLHPNWLPALSYRAVEIAYTKCDAWMGEMLAVLNENKEMLVQFLNERLPKVRPVEMEGTYLQWLDFRAYGWDIKEQERIMQQEAQLFFDEGYRFGEEGEGFERMNLACPKAVLLKALERLETVLRHYE